MRDALAAWKRFFTAEGQLLAEHPSLLFQQAFNQPDSSPIARVAAARRREAPPSRPWFRWMNKPGSGDPCLLNLRGHVDTVSCVAFSPDGSTLVSAGWEGIIRVFDAETGEPLADVAGTGDDGRPIEVKFVAFSPEGRQLLSVHKDGKVRMWDAGTWRAAGEFEQDEPRSAAWLPDGTLAIAAGNVSIVIVDRHTFEYIGVFPVPSAWSTRRRAGASGSCRLTRGGGTLLAACAEKGILAFDVTLRELAFTLETGSISAWTCDETAAWVAIGRDDGTLSIWDVAERRERTSVAAHERPIDACAVSPDGARLVTGADRELKVWDTKTWSEIASMRGHSLFLMDCAWSPRGDRIAAGAGRFLSSGELRVWTANFDEWRAGRPRHSSIVRTAVFSPDGRYVVSGTGWSNESSDRRTQTELQVWRTEDASLERTLPVLAGPDILHCLAPSGRSEFVSTAGRSSRDHTVDVWPLGAGGPRLSWPGRARAASPDGRYVAGGTPVEIWDLEESRRVAVLDDSSDGYFSAFTPHGEALITLSALGHPDRWPLAGPGRFGRIKGPAGSRERQELSSAALSSDGRFIARASRGGEIDLLDAETLGVVRVLSPERTIGIMPWRTLLAFSPDGTSLASAVVDNYSNDATTSPAEKIRELTVWDVASGRRRWTRLHGAQFTGCAWSADGRLVITGTGDGWIHARDAESGGRIATFFTRTEIAALSASPRDRLIAAGDRDGYLYLLELNAAEGV